MGEIEKFPCSDSNKARARERFYWYATLNTNRPPGLSINNRKETILYYDKCKQLDRQQRYY